jgi:hypothetical protein
MSCPADISLDAALVLLHVDATSSLADDGGVVILEVLLTNEAPSIISLVGAMAALRDEAMSLVPDGFLTTRKYNSRVAKASLPAVCA